MILMSAPGYKYSDITEKIIGSSMRVHQKMRNGYPEKIYQACLRIEFNNTGLSYSEEVELPVFYEDIQVGKRRVDFLVENKIVVELKAISELTDAHLAQALNYLEVLGLEIGLLINFGAKRLEFRRLINNKLL